MARRMEAARAAGKVSVAVLTSRLLGLVREQVLAALFGAGMQMDAWRVAFRIPNMLRDLFAEGALSSAFVPTFTRALQNKGKSDAWLLANLTLNALMVVLGGLALLFLFFSEQFVYLTAWGFASVPGKVGITSSMLEILSPFLMTIAAASVAMGMLNTLNHFFLPALAPAFFNVGVIAGAGLLAPWLEARGYSGIYAVAVGAMAGGVFQFAVQYPLLRREGFRWRPRLDLHDEGLRKIARLIGPAVIGVSAVQFNIVINTQLASLLGDGPVSWLSYAFQLIYLPIGLFGVAVGVVNLRDVSLHAARQQWDDLKETVANSIKLIAFLAIPSAVGLITLSQPIVETLYQRGRFLPEDSVNTAHALIFYSLGLFSYSCVKVYVPTFYALDDTRTPVRISVLSVVVNVVVNVALVFWLLPREHAFLGLAFGTSVSVVLNNGLLALAFHRRLGHLGNYRVLPAFARTLAAAAAMTVSLVALLAILPPLGSAPGLLAKTIRLGSLIGVGGVVYLGVCRLLGVEEVVLLLKRVRR